MYCDAETGTYNIMERGTDKETGFMQFVVLVPC